jgi:hypothetical protein
MKTKTKYGRGYIPPVWHLEKADSGQIAVMKKVLQTLLESGIDFCVVYPAKRSEDELNIISYGSFSLDEKAEILQEVVELYADKPEIKHITLE